MQKIGIIGGGAAGYFLAANLPKRKEYEITILEQSKDPLQKVRISGGGRCNVTNACFIVHELVQNYPRGKKELVSVFSVFQPKDTMNWFQKNGVPLKIEADNRVFPASNLSQSIISCLRKKTFENQVKEFFGSTVLSINKNNDGLFLVKTNNGTFAFDKLIITSGSSKKTWDMVEVLGHKIIPPLPSLFTFNCKDDLLGEMAGTSFKQAHITIIDSKLNERGAVLITHWGLSGPAILRLSAWGAKELAELKYNFTVVVNWIGQKPQQVEEIFLSLKKNRPSQLIQNIYANFGITKKFWSKILQINDMENDCTLANLSNKNKQKLIETLTNYRLRVRGKSIFKDEFVSCGGVDLSEIDFKTMQSKLIANLYFSGEVLNIDAITGGFNFQAAWSCSFVLSQALKQNLGV
jgi:predicted Rossmann fold flavoprotein